ncbi:MAG: hypothetical protein IJC56_05420 [Clostridia bacterium]|nr:hypothetical protein [Clostridia bacterium]
MPNFINSLGLDFLTDTEESSHGLLAVVAAEGKAITGYYGLPYLNHELGWAQFIENTSRMENGNLQFESFHTHCCGICEWDVRIVDVICDDSETDLLAKKLLIKTPDGHGAAITHVINADVLPSYEKDAIIRLQMIAIAQYIEYFEDQNAYADSVEASLNGKKLLTAANTLFPIGLFCDEDDPRPKDTTQICGTVKKLFRGKVEIGEDIFYPFIDCVVETQFGDIEILHTIEDVDESQYTNIRVGATVNCIAVLSGDAAINTYIDGCVLDFENDLKLVSYTFSGGDPERMRSAVSDNFEYHSEASGKHFNNIDDFIEFEKYVQANAKPCHPHYATIVEIAEGDEPLDYPVGTRCLVLTYGDSTDYAAITFVKTDADGKIAEIYLSKDSRYRFQIDDPLPEPDYSDISFEGKDYSDNMIARAHFHGLFSSDIEKEDIQALYGKCDSSWIGAAQKKLPIESNESAFAEAFIEGVKHSKATEYNEEELHLIGAQFFKDYNFYLDTYDDAESTLRDAQIFTMLVSFE